jgi:hypothetical protein
MVEQGCDRFGAWRSDDLRTLDPLPLPEPLGFLPISIARAGGALVIVGRGGHPDADGYVEEGWVARTEDERTWTVTSQGPGTRLGSVVVDGEGFLAVGGREGKLHAMHSADGQEWVDVLVSPPNGAGVLVASGPTTLLVGYDDDSPVGPSDLWRLEPDGTLTAIALGGLEPGQEAAISDLAVSPAGELLVLGEVVRPGTDASETALWMAARPGQGA